MANKYAKNSMRQQMRERRAFREKLKANAILQGEVTVSVVIPSDIYDRLSQRSMKSKTPMQTIYRQAIAEKLDRDEMKGELLDAMTRVAMKRAAE